MSSLQLDFKFEDKLKKFIEENCPYNFEIKINKTHSTIQISDQDNLNLFSELTHIQNLLSNVEYDEVSETINGLEEVEEALDNLMDKV